jgi:uncharacterized protein (TIGR02271 family)
MIENEAISGEHDNNVDPVTDRTNAQTLDAEIGNGLAKAAIGGVLGAVLGTVAVTLANKKTAQDINRSVKGVGNAVKNAASGVNGAVKNAVESVKGVAKGVNKTVESAGDTVQPTTEDVNQTVKSAASTVQAPVAPPQPVVNTTTNSPAPVAPPQSVNEENVKVSDDRLFKLYEERLVVNKKQVKTAEVAIGKHVETQKAHISIPLEKERLVVEHIPVEDGTPGIPGEADFDCRELARMEIYEETADIQKQSFVREQVSVRKEVEHKTIEVEDNIRREELDVDFQERNILEQTNKL